MYVVIQSREIHTSTLFLYLIFFVAFCRQIKCSNESSPNQEVYNLWCPTFKLFYIQREVPSIQRKKHAEGNDCCPFLVSLMLLVFFNRLCSMLPFVVSLNKHRWLFLTYMRYKFEEELRDKPEELGISSWEYLKCTQL